MLGHLDLQPRLQHLPHQTGQQTALTSQRDPVLAGPSNKQLRPLLHRLRLANRHQLASRRARLAHTPVLRHPCAPSCRQHSADSAQATPLTQSFGQTLTSNRYQYTAANPINNIETDGHRTAPVDQGGGGGGGPAAGGDGPLGAPGGIRPGNNSKIPIAAIAIAPPKALTKIGKTAANIFRCTLCKKPTEMGGTRLAQDVAVSPIAPRALGTSRSIGRASHNQALQRDLAALPRGATDIRVNQQQVNALGQRVGINRPDLQYTLNDVRHYIEYEGLGNPRGAAHRARILANDPGAIFDLRKVP